MSASGKSKNRHREYTRGRISGTGHGIYAERGKREREAEKKRKRES